MKVLPLVVVTLLKSLLVIAQTKIDLVFIVDGSGSIDSADWLLQKRGISFAIRNPTLIPLDGSIAIAVVQFSTPAPRTEVPYTIIRNVTDVNNVERAVMAMAQIGAATNPGDGIVSATALLTSTFRATANQTFCMSTDGITNSGVSPSSAITAAKNSTFGLETFGVIAIEDGGAREATFQQAYGSLVFGGGSVFVVRNTAEFASTVGFICFPNIATELVGLEVVQVSQDLKNSVALVQDKATLVRAYVQPVDPSKSERIQARLRGRRGGVELPGSPLTATSSGGIVVKANALARRNILTDSLNFIIPDAWKSGTIELELQGVGTALRCRETAGPVPNDCKATITFQAVPTLEVKFVRLRYENPPGSIKESSTTDLSALEDRLLAIFPVASIDRTNGILDMGIGIPQATAVNSRIETMRLLDLCYSWLGCDRLYYGAIDQGGFLRYGSDFTGGLANGIPGSVSSGVIEDNDDYGRNRHAHEIAHTMGAHHAVTATIANGFKVGVCGEVANATISPNFPFIETVGGVRRATIGPLSLGADNIVFGWDSFRNKVIDPTTNFELLSYCRTSRWISTYTYSSVRAYIQSNFRRRELKGHVSRKLQTSYTVIRAVVDLDTRTTTFLPAVQVRLPSAPPVSRNEYQVVGENGSGGEVFRVDFEPIQFNQDLASSGNSSAQINSMYVQAFVQTPTTGMIASVHVEQGRAAIGNDQSVSANPPTVTVIFPNGGESLSGATTTISWSSADANGDTLSYFVLFSPDNGVTWKTLATDHLTTSLVIPLNALGKTSVGLIRVQASDGFNTGEDVSDRTFITPNIPPEIQILTPSNRDFFAGVQLVVFQASSSDVEDGKVADSNLKWSSNIDGFLGSGKTFEIKASELVENNHTISLTGTDSSGAVTVATVNITIYRIAPIPPPTPSPTKAPTARPSKSPTRRPTRRPTKAPTKTPTGRPVECRGGFFNIFCLIRNFFRWLFNIFF